jgi:hypothetical protein
MFTSLCSNGWQESARRSFEAGVTEALSAVLIKNATDPEIFSLVLTQLQAIAACGLGAGLATNGTFATCLTAIQAFIVEHKFPSAKEAVASGTLVNGTYLLSSPYAESVSVVEGFLRLLALAANNARTELISSCAPVVEWVIKSLFILPTPKSVRTAFAFLEMVSRNESGITLMTSADAINSVILCISEPFVAPDVASGAARLSNARHPSISHKFVTSPLSPLNKSLAALGAPAAGKLNTHMEPAFKLLDRVSKHTIGIRELRRNKAVSMLAAAVEFVQTSDKATGSLGVKVLARVLGEDINSLIQTVLDASTGKVTVGEAEFASAVLASLSLDADVAVRMMASGDVAATIQLLDLQDGKCVSSKTATHVVQALQRVSTHNSDISVLVVSLQTPQKAIKCALVGRADNNLVAVCLSTVADLVSTLKEFDDADKLDSGSPEKSAVDYALKMLHEQGREDADLACACCRFLFAAHYCGYNIGSLQSRNMTTLVLAAMRSHAGRSHMDLQAFGTLLLTASATSPAHIDKIVEDGGLTCAIENLVLSSASVDVDTPPHATNRTQHEETGEEADARHYQATNDVLAAVSIQMLTSLCTSPKHSAAAKAAGVIRAMVAAYAVHNDNDNVFESFRELVDTIVTEDEVRQAVKNVALATQTLKLMTGDPVLFNIVEQELGSEGLVTESSPARRPRDEESSASALAMELTENLCLLEAVSTTSRLAAALVQSEGVAVVIRAIGIISVVKGIPEAEASKFVASKKASTMIPEKLQDEVLMRACNTLAELVRLNLRWEFGVPGIDPIPTSAIPASGISSVSGGFKGHMRLVSGLPAMKSSSKDRLLVRAGLVNSTSRRGCSKADQSDNILDLRKSIGRALFRPIVFKTVIRCLNIKAHMPLQTASASIALGVLSLGSLAAVSLPVEMAITHQGVEALTAALRAYANNGGLKISAATALGCLSIANREVDKATGLLKSAGSTEFAGATAVATRGGSRQIIRDLQLAATGSVPGIRWMSTLGQAELCAYLRALLCVADTAKGSELLRKQGALEALVGTLDANAVSEKSKMSDEAAVPTSGAGEPPSHSGAHPHASADFEAVTAMEDASHNPETVALIIAILSKLMDSKDLNDAIRIILSTADKVAIDAVKGPSIALCTVALTTILALSDNIASCPHDNMWLQAFDACSTLLQRIAESLDFSEGATSPELKSKMHGRLQAAHALAFGTLNCVATMAYRLDEQLRSLAFNASASKSSQAIADFLHWTFVQPAPTSVLGDTDSEKLVGIRNIVINEAARGWRLLCANAAVEQAFGATSADRSPLITLVQSLRPVASSNNSAAVAELLEMLRALASKSELLPVLRHTNLALLTSLKALPETLFTSASCSGRVIGVLLDVVSLVAAPSRADREDVRTAGFVTYAQRALQMFCDNAAILDDDTVDEHERQAVQDDVRPLMEGCTKLMSVLGGYCACPSPEEVAKADCTLACKLLDITEVDPTQILRQSVTLLTNICDIIATQCTASPGTATDGPLNGAWIPAQAADASRTAFLEVGAKSFVIEAMGHSSGNQMLLQAGAKALAALGGGDGGIAYAVRKLVVQVRQACRMTPIEGFLPPTATIEAVEGPIDLTPLLENAKKLAAMLAGSSSLTPCSYRFLFDTLYATLDVIALVGLQSESLSEFVRSAAATPLPSSRPKSSKLTSPDSRGRAASRAVRMSFASPSSSASSSSRNARAPVVSRMPSTFEDDIDEALDGVTNAPTAQEVAFTASSIASAVLQGISRLVGAKLCANRKRISESGLSGIASAEECVKFGDPEGTASERSAETSLQLGASPTRFPLVVTVSEFVAAIITGLQLNTAVPATVISGSLCVPLCEAAARLTSDLTEACQQSELQRTDSEGDANPDCSSKLSVELLLNAAEKGLLHGLCTLLDNSQYPAGNCFKPLSLDAGSSAHVVNALSSLMGVIADSSAQREIVAILDAGKGAPGSDPTRFALQLLFAAEKLDAVSTPADTNENLTDADTYLQEARRFQQQLFGGTLHKAVSMIADGRIDLVWDMCSTILGGFRPFIPLGCSTQALPKLCRPSCRVLISLLTVISQSAVPAADQCREMRTDAIFDCLFSQQPTDAALVVLCSAWSQLTPAEKSLESGLLSQPTAAVLPEPFVTVDTLVSPKDNIPKAEEVEDRYKNSLLYLLTLGLGFTDLSARTWRMQVADFHAVRACLRQLSCDALATCTIQLLRRYVGLKAKVALPALDRKARVDDIVANGIVTRVAVGIAFHISSTLYAKEAVRFLADIGSMADEGYADDCYTGATLQALGMNEECLKALQGAVKRCDGQDGADEKYIVQEGSKLIAALSEVYTSISSGGFSAALNRVVKAAEDCRYARRKVTTSATNPFEYYVHTRVSSSSIEQPCYESPPEFTQLDEALEKLLVVCDQIDADAIPEVSSDLLRRAVNILNTHASDPRTCGIVCRAFARCADHPSNTDLLCDKPLVNAVVATATLHSEDEFAAEHAVSVFRPLSVRPSCADVLKDCLVLPALCKVAEQHRNTMLPIKKRDSTGSDAEDSDAVAMAMLSPSATAPEATASQGAAAIRMCEPRIAHYCIQVMANLACDQTVDDLDAVASLRSIISQVGRDCPGTVARIVSAGGIHVLQEVISAHLDRPRVLEDALCALSNMAYSTDGIRLLIGRSLAGIIVQVLQVFNNDPLLFSMALRAVGNLTRCDENIVSVVGQGVIEGIVEGMSKNADSVQVLRLAADVIGNLASIDEHGIDDNEGMRALKAGMKRRLEKAGARDADGAKSPKSSKTAIANTIQEAVCTWLLDDGAHEGLTRAMTSHNTDAELVSACLRSLQYMAENRASVERMQSSVNLAAATCSVLRSCDFDPELCVRGSLLLAQFLRYPDSAARAAALEAGACQVLLSIMETHQNDVEVVSTVLKVLLLLNTGDVQLVTAAKQLQAYQTVLRVCGASAERGQCVAQGIPHRDSDTDARQSFTDADPAACLTMLRQAFSLLTTWCTNSELVREMAADCCSTIHQIIGPGPRSLFSDTMLVETCAILLARMGESCPEAAEILVTKGAVRVLAAATASVEHLDKPQICTFSLALFTSIAASGAQNAFAALEDNAHGLVQCIAIHWGLKSMLDEVARKLMYEQCGQALRALLNASHPILEERALADARVRAALQEVAESASAGVVEAPAVPVRRMSMTKAQLAKVPSVKALLVEDKAYAKEQKRRTKEAAVLARTFSKRIPRRDAELTPDSVLESRAGLIPWILFPRAEIEALVDAEDVQVTVWFVPEMASKMKCRRMNISLSPDLMQLTWSYTSKHYKTLLEYHAELSSVESVRVGVRHGAKKTGLLSRAPVPAKGVCLDGPNNTTILHIEAATSEEHDVLVRTFSVLCQHARALRGVHERLPEVHVAAAAVLASASEVTTT